MICVRKILPCLIYDWSSDGCSCIHIIQGYFTDPVLGTQAPGGIPYMNPSKLWCNKNKTKNKARPCHVHILWDVMCLTDDVIKWKQFPCYWPFVRGIHRSPVNSPYKGQWRGALMFSLICAWINNWVNDGEAGDLRRHRAHYDDTVTGWWYPNDILNSNYRQWGIPCGIPPTVGGSDFSEMFMKVPEIDSKYTLP